MAAAPGPSIGRRRMLVGLALLPAAVGGCALVPATSRPEDPLIALAAAARADAALAAAAIAADQTLAARVQPLADARTAHAAALDAEVVRLLSSRSTPTPAPVPAPQGPVPLARVRAAARASADTAAEVAMGLPVDRVGLVASVSACCAGYATMLT